MTLNLLATLNLLSFDDPPTCTGTNTLAPMERGAPHVTPPSDDETTTPLPEDSLPTTITDDSVPGGEGGVRRGGKGELKWLKKGGRGGGGLGS